MSSAVTCQLTSKRYEAGRVALDSVSLEVRPGTVHGLVGQNGAGKTTLMKILTGTTRATSGSVRVLGAAPGSSEVSGQVGAMIEEPAFYPYLTGRQNLELLARYSGTPTAEASTRLEQVGLGDRADSRAGGYSLGMKQRLGLAAALLGDPELLILDEPTNGLDPHAIVQVRALLRDLRDRGRTVLVSSHLLGELEQVCDVVTIIHEGAVVQEGTVAEIRGLLEPASTLVVDVGDETAARAVLAESTGIGAVEVVAPGRLRVEAADVPTHEVTRVLVAAGVAVLGVQRVEASLEDLYLGLTAGADTGRSIRVEGER
jgi:ABC-2 type transport system ATP-binding protein